MTSLRRGWRLVNFRWPKINSADCSSTSQCESFVKRWAVKYWIKYLQTERLRTISTSEVIRNFDIIIESLIFRWNWESDWTANKSVLQLTRSFRSKPINLMILHATQCYTKRFVQLQCYHDTWDCFLKSQIEQSSDTTDNILFWFCW